MRKMLAFVLSSDDACVIYMTKISIVYKGSEEVLRHLGSPCSLRSVIFAEDIRENSLFPHY